jgi:glucokinase
MIITIDVGGTKTLVVSFDGHEMLREDRFATSQNFDEFTCDLLPLLRAHASDKSPEAICLAAPGIVNHHSGTILRCGNLPWKNAPLRAKLHELGFNCPIYMDNDGNLGGLGEANLMNPVPKLLLYLTVSTGIGGGIIVNGKLESAFSNFEPGHMLLKSGGKYIIWERFASGRALVDRTGKRASELNNKILWQDQADRIAQGLMPLIAAYRPSIVVFGGGTGIYFDQKWKNPLENILHDKMPEYLGEIPPIIQAEHPEYAVIYGCKKYAELHLKNR